MLSQLRSQDFSQIAIKTSPNRTCGIGANSATIMFHRDSCAACSSWWRLPLLLATILVAMLLLQGRGRRGEDADQRDVRSAERAIDSAAEPVQLTIDFGNGEQPVRQTASWREGMTVADLMNGAPAVQDRSKGAGESAFLTQINGVANEGAGGRNWLYRVNGEHADRSFAVYKLRPGDHVLWTFAEPQ